MAFSVSSERHRQCGVKKIAQVFKWQEVDSNPSPCNQQSGALTAGPLRTCMKTTGYQSREEKKNVGK